MALAKIERERAARGEGCLGKAKDDEPIFVFAPKTRSPPILSSCGQSALTRQERLGTKYARQKNSQRKCATGTQRKFQTERGIQMSATFRDGIELAAQLVEMFGREISASNLSPHSLQNGIAIAKIGNMIREIQEPAEPLDAIEDAFQQFKSIWPKGPRNHWLPAKRAFRAAVKTRKHAISAILTGTQAYVATRPEFQYIPAPAVFLNQDRFLTDYRPPNGRGPTGNKAGAPSLFDSLRN